MSSPTRIKQTPHKRPLSIAKKSNLLLILQETLSNKYICSDPKDNSWHGVHGLLLLHEHQAYMKTSYGYHWLYGCLSLQLHTNHVYVIIQSVSSSKYTLYVLNACSKPCILLLWLLKRFLLYNWCSEQKNDVSLGKLVKSQEALPDG